MTVYQIITLIGGGFFSKWVWDYFAKRITAKAENEKIHAEAHVLNAEADGLVADSWQKLFMQVNTEWQLAINTIRKNKDDIEELKTLLAQEKAECQEKMTILYQKIQFLTLDKKP